MIVYFSGTGNSRYVARMLAQQLGEELFDAREAIRSGVCPELTSQRPWVFVSPTYGWRIPRIFVKFIRQATFSGSREAYFAMTCGSEVGNAAQYLRPLCKAKGVRFRGLLEVVMPENYLAMFPVPEVEEAEAIVRRALPVVERGGEAIAAGEDLPTPKPGLVDRLKSTVVNPVFYGFIVKDRKFRATGACIGCGHCEAVCPLHNIRMEAGRPRWQGNCTHCMACICDCPAQAIEYGRESVGKPRYHCPEPQEKGTK